MSPDPESIRKILLNARQAMQQGDQQAALGWARQAVALDPDSEEPWLFLAALSSPRASVNYLERALKINPQSQRARKGMHWAAVRLRKEQPVNSSRHETLPSPAQGVIPGTRVLPPRSPAKSRWSLLALFLAAVCLILTWAFWPGSASPVLAFLRVPHSTPAFPGVMAEIDKPTYTPSPTATSTPTATFTATPTFTLTPTSTPTPTFTPTPTPTDTPPPTETFTATDTPEATDTQIPWPTDTPEPVVNPGGGGERWIDVNLSQQRLYAYAGDVVVDSFLVSTGLSQHPTVTGQYYIYIKLLSTDMSGPGYYLPNVPYTMYFFKGYGIHGTYWHNNFGTPMSHGCVNMYTPDAQWLFDWASEGTLVNIHY